MIEAIIGREHGSNRLVLKVGDKLMPLSAEGVVPKTVSSTHCRLTIDNNGSWQLTNLKAVLQTYVDGLQVESKTVTTESRVELGADRFVLDMKKVEAALNSSKPKVYSLRPLQQVWDDYHQQQLKMQLDEKRKNVNKMLTGVLSPLSMLLFLLPLALKMEMPPVVNILRLILASVIALLAVYFFIVAHRGLKDDIILRMDRLNEDFRGKYVCPNPDCHHFLGNQPYDVIRRTKKCIYCGCKYES